MLAKRGFRQGGTHSSLHKQGTPIRDCIGDYYSGF